MAEQFRFRPTAQGGVIVGSLEPEESQLLDRLLADVAELLEPAASETADPLVALTGYAPDVVAPEDPAVLSLLPNASADEAMSAEFRRLSEFSLRTQKTDDLAAARVLLGGRTSLRLTVAEAETATRALTSVALVLAERLGVTDDDAAARVASIENPTNDDEFLAVLYNFVGWVRGALSAALIDAL